MAWWKRKKYKCLVCDKPVGESAPTVKYRYENNRVGTARLCNKCANRLESNEDMENAFNEPF